MMNRRRWITIAGLTACSALGYSLKGYRYYFVPKRFAVVEPGELYRGGWQMPGPLRRIIARYGIKTILNLACDPEESDALGEGAVVRELGIGWHKILMPGTGRGSYEQLDEAADILASSAARPLFFHCAGGEHRTNMALAAYRLKHCGWPIKRALGEITEYGFDRRKNSRQLEYLRAYVEHLDARRA